MGYCERCVFRFLQRVNHPLKYERTGGGESASATMALGKIVLRDGLPLSAAGIWIELPEYPLVPGATTEAFTMARAHLFENLGDGFVGGDAAAGFCENHLKRVDIC